MKPPLLFLSHRIPYPPNKGDKIRSWNILKYLAERADVHLGAFVDDPADFEHADHLRTVCKEVFLLELPRGRKRAVRALTALNREEPLSVALFDDRRMRDWVRQHLRGSDIEHVFVFSGQMAPYVTGFANRRRQIVMDFVDIDSDKWRQYATQSGLGRRWLYAREARTLAQFEKQIARQVDVSLFVSASEAALFKSYAGSYGHMVQALNNGVDLDYFHPDGDFQPLAETGAPQLVFTGAMDYRPNVDAVRWFADEVLPLVKASTPDVCFTIVGSKPTKEVTALAERPGISVTGRVDDVRPYIAAADVAVAPMRIARGIQNKVLEAMAMARPVVASGAAFSGIEAEPGADLLVADQPKNMAAAVSALLGDAEWSRELGLSGRERVEESYSWPKQLAKLDAIMRWPGMSVEDPAEEQVR